MSSGLAGAGAFLITAIFDLYIFVIIMRLVLQWVGASYHNQLSQFVVTVTEPLAKYLRKFLLRIRQIDLAVLVLFLLIELLKLTLLSLLVLQVAPNIIGLLIWAAGDAITHVLNFFFFTILIVVILSWVSPNPNNPVVDVLHQVTEPLLGPARRLVPAISGFDLSPILVIFALKAIEIFLSASIVKFGMAIALT